MTSASVRKPSGGNRLSVHLIEVGYTGDYGVHARVAHKLDQHRQVQANLLQHGWKKVQVHAFVVSHTGTHPQSNMAVLQALQVDDADSLLASVHMHSVNTCYSLLQPFAQELRNIQAAAGLQGETASQEPPPHGTQQALHDNGPAFGPRPMRRKHHGCPIQNIQTNTQGVMWPQQPQPAAYPPMEASSAPRSSIRLEWHPG